MFKIFLIIIDCIYHLFGKISPLFLYIQKSKVVASYFFIYGINNYAVCNPELNKSFLLIFFYKYKFPNTFTDLLFFIQYLFM